MEKQLTFIDLFAGCGGLSEGFLQTKKFKGLAHVEWEKPMVDTLRNRLNKKWEYSIINSMKKVIHFDIQKTDELINGCWSEKTINEYGISNHQDIIKNGLKGLIGKTNVNLIIGGPPCQAYSIAGRAQDKNGMQNDYRNYLFESFVKIVEEFQPDMFVFENVPGMLSAKPGKLKVTKRIKNAFKRIGYSIKKESELKNIVYSSLEFGVSQKRRRVILVGIKKEGDLNLNDIYKAIDKQKISLKKQLNYTVEREIGKDWDGYNRLNKNRLNKKNGDAIRHHVARFHNNRDIKIFKKWITKGMNKSKTIEKIAFYNDIIGKDSKHAKYRNLEWNKPSPTIVAHLHKDGLMFIHPDPHQARSITVKEAALLQSFPDDYEFIGGQGNCYKMIGNAVPVKMAKNIAIGIHKYYKQLND